MREHSRIAQRNLREAVQGPHLDRMPGVRLIRQHGRKEAGAGKLAGPALGR
jgi:GntR family transcriptional regulator of vanillate catabolism